MNGQDADNKPLYACISVMVAGFTLTVKLSSDPPAHTHVRLRVRCIPEQ